MHPRQEVALDDGLVDATESFGVAGVDTFDRRVAKQRAGAAEFVEQDQLLRLPVRRVHHHAGQRVGTGPIAQVPAVNSIPHRFAGALRRLTQQILFQDHRSDLIGVAALIDLAQDGQGFVEQRTFARKPAAVCCRRGAHHTVVAFVFPSVGKEEPAAPFGARARGAGPWRWATPPSRSCLGLPESAEARLLYCSIV